MPTIAALGPHTVSQDLAQPVLAGIPSLSLAGCKLTWRRAWQDVASQYFSAVVPDNCNNHRSHRPPRGSHSLFGVAVVAPRSLVPSVISGTSTGNATGIGWPDPKSPGAPSCGRPRDRRHYLVPNFALVQGCGTAHEFTCMLLALLRSEHLATGVFVVLDPIPRIPPPSPPPPPPPPSSPPQPPPPASVSLPLPHASARHETPTAGSDRNLCHFCKVWLGIGVVVTERPRKLRGECTMHGRARHRHRKVWNCRPPY